MSEIIFSSEPDIDLEINDLLKAFYSEEDSMRNTHLSNKLVDLLYESNVTQVSIFNTQRIPGAIINIYQAGLVHLTDRSEIGDLDWLDDILNEVIT
ncbi:hypothetical protein D3C74_363110 [compost metagenome]